MKLTPVLSSTAGVLLLFGFTACGSDAESRGGNGQTATEFVDSSAQEIMDAAQAAMAEADSLRISGTVTTEGNEVGMDFAVASSGECAGTITIAGEDAEILRADEGSWMRGGEGFWTAAAGPQGSVVAQMVGEKWVVDKEGDFAKFCDLVDEMVEGDDADETYTKGEVAEIDGAEAIAVTVEDEDGTSTAHVATEEPHHLLSLSREGEGEITFSDYGEPVEAEAPAEDEQIDLDDVG